MKPLYKNLAVGCLMFLASVPPLGAQTRQQMAIWDFGPDAANYSESPTFNGMLTAPLLQVTGGDKDSNGKDGVAYTDLRAVAHVAGQAAAWNDIKTSGENAAWTVTLDTRNWMTISARFDYRGNAATPIQSVDIEYSVDGGDTWVTHIDNAPLTGNDTTWRPYSMPGGSPFPAVLNDRDAMMIRFRNMEAGTGNGEFRFDNFEISGIRTAPTGLTATPGNQPRVVLTWTAVTGATGYRVKRSTTLNGTYSVISGSTALPTTTYTDATVANNTTYFYKVLATFNGGVTVVSADSAAVSALTPPARPAQPTATVGNQPQVILTWTAVAGATYYNVKRSTISGGPYTLMGSSANAAFTNLTVSDNVLYYYVVSAVNAGGESLDSPVRSAQTRLGPPASLTATRATPPQSGTVTVTWSAVTGATSYKVYRATAAAGPFSLLATKTAPTTTHPDTTAVNGTVYYYVVTAVSGAGESRYSVGASTCDSGLPAPSGLSAVSNNTPQVVLSWNPVPGATSYKVWRSTTSGASFAQVAGSPTASSSLADGSVLDGTTYYYVVTASAGSCDSAISIQARATLPPAPPTGLTATPSGGQVTLSWTASPGASTYNVKRAITSGGPYATVVTTAARSISDSPGGGIFYYVVTAVNNVGGESRNSVGGPVTAVVPFLVLSEVKVNPPGSVNDVPPRPESLWEYLELRGTPGYNLANHRVVVINGADGVGIGPGRAMLVVPLTGTVPASGTVLIKQAGHPGLASGGLDVLVQPAHRVPWGNDNPNDELIVNEASTILLAKDGTAPTVGFDYDNGNNGILDAGTWDALNQTILDSVGWRRDDQPGRTDRLYAGAPRLQQVSGQPDAATRIRENTTPKSAMAWWFGTLIGGPSSLAYDTADPAQLSGSVPNKGAPFNGGAFLTPGAPNEPNTVAPLGAIVAPIPPLVRFISPTVPTAFSWQTASGPQTGYDYPFAIQGSPGPTTISVVFNNNPVVFDNPATLEVRPDFFWDSWAIRIMPDAHSANRLITLLPDNDWARSRSFVLSTMEAYPMNSVGVSGSLLDMVGYHEGVSDGSTGIEFMGSGGPYPIAIADDEVNFVGEWPAYGGYPPFLSMFPNLSADLQVTREIDFEASALSGTWPNPMVTYWVGGMANGPVDDNFDLRPNRDRFFAADQVNIVDDEYATAQLRGWSKRVRTALSNSTQYAAHRLGESMQAGVDSKQPWGFNIEAMELSPDNSAMYLGLRAPLVPAPAAGLPLNDASRGNLALIVRLNNYSQITSQFDDPDAPVFGAPITLDLGGRGFRSMTRSGSTYIIVAGLSTPSIFKPGDFAVFLWDGDPAHPPVERAADLAGRNPEGITRVSAFPSGVIRLVEDNGTMDWFGEGTGNKSYPLPLWSSHRKCREFECQIGVPFGVTYTLDTPGHFEQTQYYGYGFTISKVPDPVLGYWMGGQMRQDSPPILGVRAVARPISSNPGDVDKLLNPLATSEVLPDDAVLGIAGNVAVGYTKDNLLRRIAVAWSLNSGNIIRYAVSGGNTVSEVRGIASSTIVGTFAKPGGFGAYYESLNGPATHIELPPLPGATHTYANAVNSDGLIVGASGTEENPQACVWRSHYGVYKVTKLPQMAGALPGECSEALAVNEAGTIVGYGCRDGNFPCLWAYVDSQWQAYELQSLYPNYQGVAHDINSRGEVVGTCYSPTGWRACIWINRRVVDLNTRIGAYTPRLPPGAQNVILESARSINALGLVTGTLRSPSGYTRMYLMTPIP